MIPVLYARIAAVLAVFGVLLAVYLWGRHDVHVLWDAERKANAIAAAQAAAAAKEREQGMRVQVQRTQERLNEEVKTRDARHASELDSYRKAIAARRDQLNVDELQHDDASGDRMSNDTSTAASCNRTGGGGATLDELQRAGEAVVGLVAQADRERAALMACVDSWPR